MKKKLHAGRALRCALLAAALLAIALFPVLGKTADSGAQYIVKCKDDAAPFRVVSGPELERLRAEERLEWYEPDGEATLIDPAPDIRLFGTLSDYHEDAQWNLDLIGADGAFLRGCLGQGVRVAVLDSGINPHPALEGCLVPGRNYIQDAADPSDTADTYGHGTRVAGLIAGVSDGGYIGAAPGVELVPVKITDGKSVKISALCAAIYGAIDDLDCDVLNLSLGVTTEYESLKEAVAYAEAHNVIVVSAVGNGGTAARYYPANYDTVIGVGAVDSGGAVYYRSNHNDSVLVTAPGVDVRTTAATGGYTTATGTSFAVPQVSAAAAILRAIDGTLSPESVRALIAGTAEDRGEEGYDPYYGYGILNIAGSIAALDGGTGGTMPCAFLPEAGPAEKLQNTSDHPVECTYLLAQYDEIGRCLNVKTAQYELAPGETVQLETPPEGESYGQFVYETDTMIPLTRERKGP